MTTSQNTISENIFLALLNRASEETETYRKRQISTFREIVIVQGVITWGINQLNLPPQPYELWIRILAGVTCLLAGIIGMWIIMSYKKRIYYIRDKRAEFVKRILQTTGNQSEIIDLFYPTEAEQLPKKYRTKPSSTIYSLTLIIVGILAFAVNILAGFVSQ